MDKKNRNDLWHLSEAPQKLCFSRVRLGIVSGSILKAAFLGSKFVVLPHKFIIVFGPVSDSFVYLEHTRMAGLEETDMTDQQPAAHRLANGHQHTHRGQDPTECVTVLPSSLALAVR